MNSEQKKLQPRQVIKCPHCHYEYLPAEVLYPDNVIGKPDPNSIMRDALGHIIYEEYDKYDEPLAEETYYCEHCGKPFIIEVETKFKTRAQAEELDFSTTSVGLFD